MDYLKRKSLEFVLTLYISGFIAWNLYLGHFGFFENDLLQTRFLSAGILVLIIPIILILIPKLRGFYFSRSFFVKISTLFLWIIFFSIVIFPQVPQYFGGAKPYLTSLIVNKEFSETLKVMGLLTSNVAEKNYIVESIRGCEIYANKEIVILGFIKNPIFLDKTIEVLVDRVLIISRDQIAALSTLPQNVLVSNDLRQGNSSSIISQYDIGCPILRSTYGVFEPFVIKK